MNNYNEMIGEMVSTDGGDYTIEAHVHDDGCCDQSINDRINPYGRQPHNPVLRWMPGRAAETIKLESALTPADEGYTGECDYNNPYGVWGDDGSDDALDRPISDDDWEHLLDCVGIR